MTNKPFMSDEMAWVGKGGKIEGVRENNGVTERLVDGKWVNDRKLRRAIENELFGPMCKLIYPDGKA